ncbi:BTAD domain-containing putative transcriptional regulator [Streptomyces sp. NPDC051940]|uniref:AfsR/SARP family transcriptional regulator n=1 Tax=Streptomyces sp. NPDC051940 TaxID=3155675 RepID=UPI0034397978
MRFCLLGPLDVHDGPAERPLTGTKARALLAFLLLHANRAVPLGTLRSALWGQDPPATASASLHNHVSRLRRALGADGPSRLRATRGGYLLAVGEEELDSEVFTRRLAGVRALLPARDWESVSREAAGALALWRGVPLGDLPEDFLGHEQVQPRVQELCETRLLALEWRVDAELELGRYGPLAPELARLAGEHPLREVFHRQLMVVLHRMGRQAEALAVYQRLRRTLVDELGVEPGPEVRAAHRAVLTDRGSAGHAAGPPRRAAAPPPAQLPAGPAELCGRKAELEELVRMLRPAAGSAGPRTVVVSGMPGVGKSALAVHAAQRLRDCFPDGQLYADLRGSAPGAGRDAHRLLARLLGDLGAGGRPLPELVEDRAALLRSALSGRRVLLVLDDAASAAHVAPLLPGGGGCAVLVTSRRMLTDLPATGRLEVRPLDDEGRRSLLSALCGTPRLEAEPAAAERILTACDGLPLALRIVGAQLAARPGWPLGAVAARLEIPRGRLGALSAGRLTVRDAFAPDYAALRDGPAAAEAGQARAFRLLGLWPRHPLSVEPAAALLGLPVDAARELLEGLVDGHLLRTPRPDRYAFHSLLGEYAAERAAAEEPRAARTQARLRLLVWYTAAVTKAYAVMAPDAHPLPAPGAEAGAPLPEFADEGQALAWCVAELPALSEAIRWAAGYGRSELAWRMAAGLSVSARAVWWAGGWERCVEPALRAAERQGDLAGQGWLHTVLGLLRTRAQRYDLGLDHLWTARHCFADAGDAAGQAMVYAELARVYRRLGRYPRALELTRRAAALYRQAGAELRDPGGSVAVAD